MSILNKQNSLRLLQHLREDPTNPLASLSLAKGRQALITLQERTMTTPYQELIERVRKIDKEAAEYLEEEAMLLPYFTPKAILRYCFFYTDAPQGQLYWQNLSKQLGEYPCNKN